MIWKGKYDECEFDWSGNNVAPNIKGIITVQEKI